MDILLTHGYFLYEDAHERAVMRPYPPLGLLYLSAHLKARGFAVALADNTFGSPEAFRQRLLRERPPVVGFYANMLTRRAIVPLMAACRAVGATVVVGGPDPANYVAEYLAHGADIVVIGEGEATLEALLPHLARHGPRGMQAIAGIAYREEDGTLVRTAPRAQLADLDAQPFPDRAAIDMGAYLRVWRESHGMGAVSLITARGCPYKCTWCSHAVFGYSHRRRSPGNVADEVAQIVEQYDPELLWYADDVFTIHHRWLFEFAAELKRRGLRRPFESISREDRLNERVVATLAEMGCYRIWVGAESGSQRILDAMQRRTDAARVVEMVHLLQRHDIQAGMFIMLGYDGEQQDDLEATLALLQRAAPDIFLTTVAYPIKNTHFYEQVAERVRPRTRWAEGSDRDLTVQGRHSPRFYRFATRWLVNEVARQRPAGGWRGAARRSKALLNAQVGRVGMALTAHEREA